MAGFSAGAGAGGGARGAGGGGGPSPGGGGVGGPDQGSAPPPANLSELGFAVKVATGDYHRAWVIDKLTTFKVGAACAAKLPNSTDGVVASASFYTRDVADWAKDVTGNDWATIEAQNNNDREVNRHYVEPMVDAFRDRFHLTIMIDGDDCDTRSGALWLKYWGQIGPNLHAYPPPAKKAFITIEISPNVRVVTATVDSTGTNFHITAPRDIEEAASWDETIAKPFRRLNGR